MDSPEKKQRGRPRKVDIPTVETSQSTWEQHQAYVTPTPLVGTTTPVTTAPQQGRVFTTQQSYEHDLYKLQVNAFMKNVALAGSHPEYEKAEHVHWFHTITSDGKPQTRSNSVGGHFHKMEIIPQGKGQPPTVRCASGPLREVVQIVNGKRVKREVPVNDVDHHTHDVQYVRSNIIIQPTRNMEAAKAEAAIMARFQASIPGVEAGD